MTELRIRQPVTATANIPEPQAMPRPIAANRNIMSRGSRTTVRKRISESAPRTPTPRARLSPSDIITMQVIIPPRISVCTNARE